MTKKFNLTKEIAKTLKIKKQISENTALNAIEEFDSIGRLTFIAFADKKFKKNITGDQLAECKTVKDLLNLLS